jgi:hypothetical protein
MSLLVSLWLFIYYTKDSFPSLMFTFKVGAMSSLYLVLALASKDMRPLQDTLSLVWAINCAEEIAEDVRRGMILDFIERAVVKWRNLYYKFQEIVNESEVKQSRFTALKGYFKDIKNGEVSVAQIGWIMGYLVYSVIISANIFEIPAPIDFLVNFAFFIIILLSNGNIKGIGTVMSEVLETIKPSNTTKISTQLNNLKKIIKRGCHTYHFFDYRNKEE